LIDDENHLSIPCILKALHSLDVQSLMVEGGAKVIQSFFANADVVDSLIVTVAPHDVGEGISHGVELRYNQVNHLEASLTSKANALY
jgi:2,5-diamino-6-(ribosylamino)-4(3H)-pyrimidinone 5'-phosphate reductase